MDELPPNAARLLEAARREHNPTPDDSERVRAALLAALIAPVAPVEPGVHAHNDVLSQAPGASGWLSISLKKLVVVSTLVGGIGMGAYLTRAARVEGTRSPASQEVAAPAQAAARAQVRATASGTDGPETSVASAPQTEEQPARAETVEPERTVAREASPRRAMGARAVARATRLERASPAAASAAAPALEPKLEEAPHTPTDTAESAARVVPEPSAQAAANGELALMRAALAHLNTGDARDALAALDLHAARYPRGVLSEERSGLRAIALCATGELAAGRAAQESFLRSTASSPLSRRVRNACPAREQNEASTP